MKTDMLQPRKRSFGEYVKLGYLYSSHNILSEEYMGFFDAISSIDDGILIIDDIFDKSEMRNGEPCLYKNVGIQAAMIEAEILKCKGVENLGKLMQILHVPNNRQVEVWSLYNKFIEGIFQGEKIDYELGQLIEVSNNELDRYFQMIINFTGGHIKYGLAIGQLLANCDVDSDISKIAISIGIIRQICDDFNDYFAEHHELCGDLILGKNRLPELIYKLEGGNIKQLQQLIAEKNFDKIRNIVLCDSVRKQLYEFCKIEIDKIHVTDSSFVYDNLIENYNSILVRK